MKKKRFQPQKSHKRRGKPNQASHDFSLTEAAQKTAKQLNEWLTPQKAASMPQVKNDQFSLDPWQKQAVDALEAGESVVVDAPTTAGKTRVVESFFDLHLEEPDFRAAYTTPVKSLSNDKYLEFQQRFGAENVGLATGDKKEKLHAPIVVCTLESYRNSLLGVEPDLGRRLVVFDEYHYLQDEGRGSAWEEAIILTPPDCQILMLSASVKNPELFCQWLVHLGKGRKSKLVQTLERPVPLEHFVWIKDQWLLRSTLPPAALKKINRAHLKSPIPIENLVKRLPPLIDLKLTPCIIYGGKRLTCEQIARQLSRLLPVLDEQHRHTIAEVMNDAQKQFNSLGFIPNQLRQMIQTYGVAYHHSGLAAPARLAIEMLIKNGHLRFCCATMGLSLGINFAVRSALISDFKRPGENGPVTYPASEVLQMLGRAGRRGKDKVGFSLWPTLEANHKFGYVKRENCNSQLRTDPTTFLGLVGRGYSLRAIENFYSKSFLRFHEKGTDLSLISKTRILKKLGEKQLPCHSPAAEFGRYWFKTPSKCEDCSLRKKCHKVCEAKLQSDLAILHVHLHQVEALANDETLTKFGNTARYIPQSGGLLVASWIAEGKFDAKNMLSLSEICAALTTASYKTIDYPKNYKLPMAEGEIIDKLMHYYPEDVFPECYDPPFRSRDYSVIKEFNVGGGYIISEWARGCPWPELVKKVTNDRFSPGDVMNLIYRTATYMQSISQFGEELLSDYSENELKELKESAKAHRSYLLREPLDLALNI